MAEDDNLMANLASFLAITNTTDEGVALNWLTMAGMDLQEALNLFWAQGSSTGTSAAYHEEYGIPRKRSLNNLLDEEGRRIVPDDPKRQRLIENPVFPAEMLISRNFQQTVRRDVESIFGGPGDFQPRTAKEETLNSMYAPPHSIMCHEHFLTAREIAKTQRKWLLVNLNKNTEFACHTLNRDVWKDEGVQDLIQMGYIFWNQQDSSPEGGKYIERYKVKRYPYVALIDPRTGAVLWEKDSNITLDCICDKLSDYIYSNTYPADPESSHSRSRSESLVDTGLSSSLSKSITDTEDEDIVKAIALSLQSNIEKSLVTTSHSVNTMIDLIDDDTEEEKKVHLLPKGFHMKEILAYLNKDYDHSNEIKDTIISTEEIKIQLRLPQNKKIMKLFPIHQNILSLAAMIAIELQNIENLNLNAKDYFEIYLTYPRIALSEARNAILESLASTSTTQEDIESYTMNKSTTAFNGLDKGGIVSLWSIGITKDTVLAVEFVS